MHNAQDMIGFIEISHKMPIKTWKEIYYGTLTDTWRNDVIITSKLRHNVVLT